MKRKNILRTFAAVIATVLTVTSVGNYTALAEEGEVPSSENTSVEEEKELLQYSDDWTIFQYLDDAGKPTFDVKHVLYPISKVESNKLLFQYRIIYKCDENFELNSSSWQDLDTNISSKLIIDDSWDDDFIADDSTCAYKTTISSHYNLDDTIPEETITDIENNKTNYFIQFRLVNTDNQDTTISKSYTLLIYPQDEPFPYVVSSNIDCCEIYDVTSQSTDFTINLVFNGILYESDIDVASVNLNYPISSDYLFGETYQTNLTTNPYGISEYVDNKRYQLYRTEVSFDVRIPSYHLMDTDENLTFNCLYTFNGLEGDNTQKAPDSFMFSICVPPLANRTLAESINITSPSTSLKLDTPLTLTANILPENATNKSVTWSSSNPAYASVDTNGVVTAMAAGAGKNVTITATAKDGSGVTGTCTLTILGSTNVPVKEIAINAPSSTVKPGSKIALSATVAPSNATNSGVTWSSSNTAYATVDANGVVTAMAAGAGKNVTITATANDGSGVSGTYTLQIQNPTTEPETPGTQEEPKEPEKTQPVAITTAKVTLSKTSLAYNGKAQKPSVKSVKLGSTTLKAGTDYIVTYKNNKNIGTATVTITGKGNYTGTVKKTFKIVAKKGTTFTVGSYKYKITSTSTVAFAGLKSSKTTKVTIPSTVKIGGTTFKVTSIADKALWKKTKVTSVTIGANVTTIGKEAFNGCKKLGTIAVKSTKLKTVGKNALKEIKSTAKIKVPSKKLSAYKKLLKSKGQGKKVTITK